MDAEGRLQQVVAVFRYLGIDTRVGVLQDDILEGSLVFALVISAPSAGRIIALTKSGDRVDFSLPTTLMRSPQRSELDLLGVFCHFVRSGPIVSTLSLNNKSISVTHLDQPE
jgi:hypothetical protein